MGSDRFFYANEVKIYQFKSKDYQMKPWLLFLGNILKDCIVKYMEKQG